MIASFTLLTGDEVLNLPKEISVFIFPVGGCEEHGPHLPLGTKILQAEEKSKKLAEKMQEKLPGWNFIVMPTLPISVDSITSKIALTVRPHVVRDAIVDQVDALKKLGFTLFAVLSAQLTPKQLSAIEDAGRIVSRRKWGFFGEKSILVSLSSSQVSSKDVWNSPMIAIPQEHAGANDTAWVQHFQPQWKPYSGNSQPLDDVATPKASIGRFLEYFRGDLSGYWGKPKLAEPARVPELLSTEVSELAERFMPVLEKGKGMSFFKSGYRYFPLNGSFFKAYLLASIFFVMMFLWVMWSLKDVFDAS
jgi:creatinine amidohydrolase/Fe(II)-dependent formamide hydrolase-like protein